MVTLGTGRCWIFFWGWEGVTFCQASMMLVWYDTGESTCRGRRFAADLTQPNLHKLCYGTAPDRWRPSSKPPWPSSPEVQTCVSQVRLFFPMMQLWYLTCEHVKLEKSMEKPWSPTNCRCQACFSRSLCHNASCKGTGRLSLSLMATTMGKSRLTTSRWSHSSALTFLLMLQCSNSEQCGGFGCFHKWGYPKIQSWMVLLMENPMERCGWFGDTSWYPQWLRKPPARLFPKPLLCSGKTTPSPTVAIKIPA